MPLLVARTEEEMLEAGRQIAASLQPGDVVLLVGEMGAGKTTIAKGIVEGFGAGPAESVSSPTFTLVHEYRQQRTVYHTDLYRLESPQQVLSIGIEDLLDSGELLLVEWGERYPALWPPSHGKVEIRDCGDRREITFAPPHRPL